MKTRTIILVASLGFAGYFIDKQLEKAEVKKEKRSKIYKEGQIIQMTQI